MPSDPDSVLSIVEALYDAALDPEAWPSALDQLSDFTRSQFAHLFFVNPKAGPAPVFATVSKGAPDAGLNRYHAHYEAIDPRLAAGAKQPSGIVVPDWAIVPQDDFVSGEFYNDFYAPLGLRWLACSAVVKNESFVAHLGLTRGVDDEPFSEDDCRRAARLLPHLARAATIQDRLGVLEAGVRTGFAMLDRLPIGVIVLSHRGGALFINRSAEQILAQNDGLSFRTKEGLVAARHDDTRALERAVRRVTSVDALSSLEGYEVVRVSRPSHRRPYLVLAAPASGREGLIRQSHGAVAYVLIQDTDTRVQPKAESIAAVHGFTRAEADVACGLAAGRSLREIAERRHTSVHTARWLLKQAMAKTGTRTQADLVSLLLTGPAAFDA